MKSPNKNQRPFLWGAATSGHQIDGNNLHSDWWQWEAQGMIEGGVRSGAATDHWNRYREDISLAADLGLNSYRFSVEWARVEPIEGQWDESALGWYLNLIRECESHGIVPMVTLHHFSSPQWFAALGGFTQDGCADKFSRFVEKVVERLGSRVPLWCTLNEPMVLVIGSYLGKFMPPGVFSLELASRACEGLLRCHVAAYDILHSQSATREGPWKELPIEVGIAHNMIDFLAERAWHPAERVLVSIFHRFYNQSWLDAVTGGKQKFGIIGMMPTPCEVSEARGRKTADFIGVNYYTKAYVQWRPKDVSPESPPELPIGLSFGRKNDRLSDLSWAIHPRGFRKVLKTAKRYGLPIYVTENGIADRKDALRSEYLLSHLREVAIAKEEGIDIRGYYHWSLLDNFEWIKGFGPRFGLFQVDYETFERAPTNSARLYQKLIRADRARNLAGPSRAYF